MYSVKPGRGPSLLSAILALVIGVPFALFWLGTASRIHAPRFFIFFGIVFLLVLVASAFIGFYNATSKDRMSQFEITTPREERDPFDRLAPPPPPASGATAPAAQAVSAKQFCPFCGTQLGEGFNFCPKCGKPQPAPSPCA